VAIKIDNVLRVDGRVVEVKALVGDIEIVFRRSKDSDEPDEAYRFRDVQILDKDSLYIRDSVFKKLRRQINAIFSEVPLKSYPPRKKNKVSGKRKLEVLQGKLF